MLHNLPFEKFKMAPIFFKMSTILHVQFGLRHRLAQTVYPYRWEYKCRHVLKVNLILLLVCSFAEMITFMLRILTHR